MENDFEAQCAAFLDGLRALTERTGIVVSAEAMDGENAQVTLAIRPKGAGWYRYVDGGVAWRSASDHEAEKEQYRTQIRAMELAIPNKARSMFAAESAALRDTRKRLAALESEDGK